MLPLSDINTLIQGLIAAVIIGMFHNIYATTKVYGGMIGSGIRILAVGILFVAVAAIEKMLVNLSVVPASTNLALIQDGLILVGLFFLGWGFSKLAHAAKG